MPEITCTPSKNTPLSQTTHLLRRVLVTTSLALVSLALLGGCSQWAPQKSAVAAPVSDEHIFTNTHSPGINDKHMAGSPSNGKSTTKTGQVSTSQTDTSESIATAPEVDAPPADLWERIRGQYGLNITPHPKMDSYIRWYASHQRYIDRVSERGSRYMHYIVEQIETRGLPAELALLPIIESAFDPFAYSHGRASGMWQFVPATGRSFGLHQNWWYDGRRHVTASTNAALDYLERLHRQFDGNWLYALAAYNSGGGNVRKAIRRNKKAGKPTDFWSLKLPRETRAYVPQLLALATVVKRPSDYNITLPPIADTPVFAEIMLDSQLDLTQAAEFAGIDTDELYLFNPGYNRWATPPEGKHTLLVPIAKKAQFEQRLADLPVSQRVKWQRYEVKSGDSLISIAKRHHITVNTLKSTNKLRSNIIRIGQTLMIPTAWQGQNEYTRSASQRLEKQQHKPRNGRHKHTYKVKAGDSFWKIGRQHNVSSRQVARWNGMAPGDTLRAGQELVIWSQQTAAIDTSAAHGNGIVRKVYYKVRRGDSLARIAQKFRVNIADITRWNTLDASRYLQPGQALTLFVDITNTH